MDFPPRGPFTFHVQSRSPAVGCLMLIVGVAMVVAVVGLLALVRRLIWSPFARPPSVADQHPSPQRVDAIEVESEVVTDESSTHEAKN